MQDYTNIEYMIGETFVKVEKKEEELKFIRNDGSYVCFWNDLSCREQVYIEEIIGNLDDLIGTPILVAEERIEARESYYWTFYEFRTIKGSVTVRWLCESNGYYSESIDWYDSKYVKYIPYEHQGYQ